MRKPVYIRCPRCELNYIEKKEKLCSVCKAELSAKKDEFMDDIDLELCPICKVNYLIDGETICQSCQEEQQAYDKDDDIDWKTEVEKSSQDEDEELDLLPIEDNDEINEEMQHQFSKDLDEDFIDEEKGVSSIEEAIQGAKDIVAEMISDTAEYRKDIRKIIYDVGLISTKASKAEEKSVYEKANHALSPFILIQYTSNLHDLMHPYYIMSNGIVNGL